MKILIVNHCACARILEMKCDCSQERSQSANPLAALHIYTFAQIVSGADFTARSGSDAQRSKSCFTSAAMYSVSVWIQVHLRIWHSGGKTLTRPVVLSLSSTALQWKKETSLWLGLVGFHLQVGHALSEHPNIRTNKIKSSSEWSEEKTTIRCGLENSCSSDKPQFGIQRVRDPPMCAFVMLTTKLPWQGTIVDHWEMSLILHNESLGWQFSVHPRLDRDVSSKKNDPWSCQSSVTIKTESKGCRG